MENEILGALESIEHQIKIIVWLLGGLLVIAMAKAWWVPRDTPYRIEPGLLILIVVLTLASVVSLYGFKGG